MSFRSFARSFFLSILFRWSSFFERWELNVRWLSHFNSGRFRRNHWISSSGFHSSFNAHRLRFVYSLADDNPMKIGKLLFSLRTKQTMKILEKFIWSDAIVRNECKKTGSNDANDIKSLILVSRNAKYNRLISSFCPSFFMLWENAQWVFFSIWCIHCGEWEVSSTWKTIIFLFCIE